MKKIILLIAPILLSLTILSQSNDELSDGYFMRANQAYGNGNLKEALMRLDKSASYLRRTHPGIEALYVKVYKEQGDYISAERHLEKYFNKAQKEHKEYQEMLSLAVDVRDGADLQREKKLKEIEAKKQKLKEEQERLKREKLEREQKAIEREQEKQEVSEYIKQINTYISNKNYAQAEKLYNKIKSSEFYADYKVNNIEDLKCYKDYSRAERINTVYAYDKYIKTNANCFKVKDAKNKLETLTIQEGDKLALLTEEKYKTKAIEYYNIYLSNFPNGSKSSYARNKINTLKAQKTRLERKKNSVKYLDNEISLFDLYFPVRPTITSDVDEGGIGFGGVRMKFYGLNLGNNWFIGLDWAALNLLFGREASYTLFGTKIGTVVTKKLYRTLGINDVHLDFCINTQPMYNFSQWTLRRGIGAYVRVGNHVKTTIGIERSWGNNNHTESKYPFNTIYETLNFTKFHLGVSLSI